MSLVQEATGLVAAFIQRQKEPEKVYYHANFLLAPMLQRGSASKALLRSVLLNPIDFSDNAATILKAAAYVAGAFKAELHLVFVVQNFEDYSGFFVPPVNLPNLEEELYASAQQQMDAFVAEHRQLCLDAGVSIVTSKVLAGDVGEEVVKYAAQKDIQLIVMGTHGYKGLERIMFGSVAEKVVKTAACAVMTINPYRDRGEVKP